MKKKYCSNVTISNKECKTTVKGIEYAGTVSQTIFGDQCQSWSAQPPDTHNVGVYNHEFPENNVTEANNYCRNAGNSSSYGPWCYTMNTEHRWEYCLISIILLENKNFQIVA